MMPTAKPQEISMLSLSLMTNVERFTILALLRYRRFTFPEMFAIPLSII